MKCIIYYFSGTGNTHAVLMLFKKALEDEGGSCELIRIEDITRGKRTFTTHDGARIGLAYPIHAGDAPEIIDDLVSMMPMGNMDNLFILNTAADFIHANDAAAKRIIKKLKNKSYHVDYERTIVMGSNFFMRYNDRFTRQVYEIAKIKVRHMLKELEQGKSRIRPAGPMLKTMAYLGHVMETFGSRQFGKRLKATDDCTHCGICVRDCPSENISDENGRIVFSNKCIWCMRCMYACPVDAIKPRLMRFTMIKDGYDLKAILKHTSNDEAFVDENTKGFYKHFYRYIQDPSI